MSGAHAYLDEHTLVQNFNAVDENGNLRGSDGRVLCNAALAMGEMDEARGLAAAARLVSRTLRMISVALSRQRQHAVPIEAHQSATLCSKFPPVNREGSIQTRDAVKAQLARSAVRHTAVAAPAFSTTEKTSGDDSSTVGGRLPVGAASVTRTFSASDAPCSSRTVALASIRSPLA